MRALAAVLLFAWCSAGAVFTYVHHIGNGSSLFGAAASITLLVTWLAISDD